QALLDVGGQLDREDAEVAGVVVHLHRRVTGRPGRLLVRREQRVLESRDERALFDSLVALDLADGLDDLLGHVTLPFTSDIGMRLARTISRYGISVSVPSEAATFTLCSPAERTSPLNFRPAVRSLTRRPTAAAKCSRR